MRVAGVKQEGERASDVFELRGTSANCRRIDVDELKTQRNSVTMSLLRQYCPTRCQISSCCSAQLV